MYNSEIFDSLDHFDSIIILRWKDDYYRRERRKKIFAFFLFSLLFVSGFVAFFWTYREQVSAREVRNVVRSRIPLEEYAQLISETSTSTSTEISSSATPESTAETFPPSPFCPQRTVGYYSGSATREISEIQISKLTHVIFSHLKLDLDGNVSFRGKNEMEKFLNLKKKLKGTNVKLMVSVEEDGVDFQFSEVSKNAEKRKFFIENLVSFVQKHSIDGVDIAWMHPWPADLKNQVKLFQELREHLNQPYIISLVTPPLGKPLANDLGENLPNIMEYVDFLNIKTLDYWKFWRHQTGPSAPLYSGIGKERKPSVNDTISYYLRKCGGTEKLNLGIGFHGIFWNNVKDSESNGIWNPVEMKKGHLERGKVSWRNVGNRSMAVWDEESKTSYIWDKENRKFLSFENRKSLRKKMEYFDEKNLEGVTIWSMEMDDDEESLLGEISSCGNNQ